MDGIPITKLNFLGLITVIKLNLKQTQETTVTVTRTNPHTS